MYSLARRSFFGASKNVGERITGAVSNYGFMVIVGEQYATMIHRFSKFQRQLEPGVNFIVPFID